jgi:hypothetical protein
VDGPIELRFHEWGLDRFGDRELLPYHVELSLEGIPHHAWFREIAEKILCDEAIIRHVEDTERHLDYRVCQCWAVCRDPSRIPQMVFMSLAKHETDPRRNAQVHIVRPRAALHSNVFKILVHIDVVEDLMFYHYPREELIADDKVPWRDFNWQFGRADGDLDEEELHPPRSICEPDEGRYHRHPRDDEDNQDRSRKRPHPRGFFSRMSGCLDTRGRSRDRNQERSSSRGWQRGESSGTRFRAAWDCSPPPGRHNPDPAVKRALAEMWKEKGVLHGQTSMQDMGECTARSEAILIIPQDNATWSEQLAGENVSPAVNNMLGEGEEFVPSASEVVRDKAEKGEESARVTHLGGHGRWGSRQTNILIVPQGNMFRAGQEHGSKGPSVVLSEEASEGRVDSGTLNSTREIREANVALDPCGTTIGADIVVNTQPSQDNREVPQDIMKEIQIAIHQEPRLTKSQAPRTESVTATEGQDTQISPTTMDLEIQQQGLKLQEMMRLFKQTTTEPICSFILQTPHHKLDKAQVQTHLAEDDGLRKRESPRLKGKTKMEK